MIDLKKLLTFGAAFMLALGATGCDDDECESHDDCDDGYYCDFSDDEDGEGVGVCVEIGGGGGDIDFGFDDGTGGTGGGDGGEDPGVDFTYVLIVDDSDEVAANGTPGVDICGVRAKCGSGTLSPIDAELYPGDGGICGEDLPVGTAECSADRADPEVVFNYGSCNATSNPSDYVSLGVGGTLVVEFGEDLQGCTIEILEATGGNPRDEYATVSVCADANGSECILDEFEDVDIGEVYEGDNPARIDVPSFD